MFLRFKKLYFLLAILSFSFYSNYTNASDLAKYIREKNKQKGMNNPQAEAQKGKLQLSAEAGTLGSSLGSINRKELSTFTDRGIAWNPENVGYSEDQRALRQTGLDKWVNVFSKLGFYALNLNISDNNNQNYSNINLNNSDNTPQNYSSLNLNNSKRNLTKQISTLIFKTLNEQYN